MRAVRILVCVKAVVRERPELHIENGVPLLVPPRQARLLLNESDAHAVDAAVDLARASDGSVTAATVGALTSQEALYTALAKGADEALRVDSVVEEPLQVARLLAGLASRESFDLILTGIESRDGLSSAVGPALSALLDLPFAASVSRIEALGDRVRVTREQGGGLLQTLEMPLPAVLSVLPAICPLRLPPPIRMSRARQMPPRSLSLLALGVDPGDATAQWIAASPPPRERETEILEGAPAEIARDLMDRIEAALRS